VEDDSLQSGLDSARAARGPSAVDAPLPPGSGRMWLEGRYRGALERAGLATFEQVMAARHGQCMRVVGDRENWYLQVADAAQPGLGMYLKKHRVHTWLTRLWAGLGMPLPVSAGRREARNVESLAALAIDVPRLVADGEKFSANGRLESFLLTEELAGYVELQDFVRRRFPACARRGGARDHDLARLLRQVAGIARRFHQAGYNHRDFYSCHFLTKELAPGQFDIRLIDLQRMQRRRWFRRRWIVKDLAQLAHMLSSADCLSCRDKLAFMRHYLGVRKLAAADKRLIRSVLRKQAFIERHERRWR